MREAVTKFSSIDFLDTRTNCCSSSSYFDQHGRHDEKMTSVSNQVTTNDRLFLLCDSASCPFFTSLDVTSRRLESNI